MRRAFLLLLCLIRPASAADVGAALRRADFPAAERAVAGSPDPVAPKLVRFLRLTTRGAGTDAEIDAFLADNPGWPGGALLSVRYAEALASDPDDAAVRALCVRRPPAAAAALLRCAAASGDAAWARRAWLTGVADAATETAVMHRWGAAIDAPLQADRFARLAWTGKADPGGALARQAVRLEPGLRPAAEARLALRRDDPAGPALFAALPAAARTDPGLVLDLARAARRADRLNDAAAVWLDQGAAAERAAPPERQRLFAEERVVLARRLLRVRDDDRAYRVAALIQGASDDADFLAGWIALRRLGRPDLAGTQFQALADRSRSAVAQARAQYWLGRAATGAAAEAAFRRAAAWPTTYYGQLATIALDGAVALADRLRAAVDPVWTESDASALTGNELARAATLLVAWGLPQRAPPFLERLEGDGSAAQFAMLARFAAAIGLPDAAVATARRAGRDGVMLPDSGWPSAAEPPPPVDRAIVLGLVRQESSFDPAAASPAGAQGLMQLMPGTAADIARRIGAPAAPLLDPATNLRLGTAYLGTLLDRFGALPPALAGYNAGPGRARDWLAAAGDPAAGAIDPIDWIELIPFTETRDYVQRVVENVVIYRARAGGTVAHPVLAWSPAT